MAYFHETDYHCKQPFKEVVQIRFLKNFASLTEDAYVGASLEPACMQLTGFLMSNSDTGAFL